MSPKWAKSRFLHEKLMKILKINANLSFFKVLKITTYRKIVKAPPPFDVSPRIMGLYLKMPKRTGGVCGQNWGCRRFGAIFADFRDVTVYHNLFCS